MKRLKKEFYAWSIGDDKTAWVDIADDLMNKPFKTAKVAKKEAKKFCNEWLQGTIGTTVWKVTIEAEEVVE